MAWDERDYAWWWSWRAYAALLGFAWLQTDYWVFGLGADLAIVLGFWLGLGDDSG